jgi:hypothetical protein
LLIPGPNAPAMVSASTEVLSSSADGTHRHSRRLGAAFGLRSKSATVLSMHLMHWRPCLTPSAFIGYTFLND